MRCNNRKELIERIVDHLLDEGLLDDRDYTLVDELKSDVSKVIERELDDYVIIYGDVLD